MVGFHSINHQVKDQSADMMSQDHQQDQNRFVMHSIAPTKPATDSEPSAWDDVESCRTGLRRGDIAGRYVILARLGKGGMGEVYAAHDPALDRKVALKLMRPKPGGHDEHRLLCEGQALARLSHPNIVSVHDVGIVDPIGNARQVFIAMELIEGVTLRRWLESEARSTEDILEVFVSVARGIAAAHTSGIIHRDVKPDNIMIGSDGRVRIVDLGLARIHQTEDSMHDIDVHAAISGACSAGFRLTREGAFLGTPAYMAPELWDLCEADERSDQFAFCVSLWEALFDALPFQGATVPAIASSITRGELVAFPKVPRRTPKWLNRILVRGLSRQSAMRFATMQDLIDSLDVSLRRQKWTIAFGVVACLSFCIALLYFTGVVPTGRFFFWYILYEVVRAKLR